MVKVFSINCIFGNQRQPFEIYIGKPEATHHPIHWQKEWLASSKNGTIPEDFLNSLQKLFESAQKNNANFEDLCEYALISASKNINQGNEGIAKINSTVKGSDIDRYAEEFTKSGKKLSVEGVNAEQKNQTEKQVTPPAAEVNSNSGSKKTFNAIFETKEPQQINQAPFVEVAKAQEASSDFMASAKLNSDGIRDEKGAENQTADSVASSSTGIPLANSSVSSGAVSDIQPAQAVTPGVTSNVYGDDEDIL
jgi:hypothetical protein